MSTKRNKQNDLSVLKTLIRRIRSDQSFPDRLISVIKVSHIFKDFLNRTAKNILPEIYPDLTLRF